MKEDVGRMKIDMSQGFNEMAVVSDHIKNHEQ